MSKDALAAIFLVMVATVPAFAIARCLLRPNFTVPQALLLTCAELLTRLLWRMGKPPAFPRTERGAVIVCNHRSSIDPFFVQVCCNRPIRWLVAREFCEHPLFRWFLTTCDVIPVNRGGIDTAATKAAIRCVQSGGLIGMFPEGRINITDGFMLPVRPGAVVVAVKADVPVIPCYIKGSPYDGTPWSPFLMAARVRVQFGCEIHPRTLASQFSELEIVQSLIFAAVRQLASMAGQPDFQPELAGRRWMPAADQANGE
jgi:1-acyl-sn-glycerol-3-phosphate acyltransferase